MKEIAAPGQLKRYAAEPYSPMNTRNAIITASLILLLCPLTAAAQEGASVCSKIENSVTNAAPKWKLARKPKRCDVMSLFKWASGKSEIYVLMWPRPSVDDATAVFRSLATDNSDLLAENINVLGTGLREFGDDNRLWMTPTFGSKGIDFRKGKFVVRVTGSTLEASLQFAAYVAQVIPAA